ncbi:hypothetical protein EHQ68_09835 [Leptospira congkakensis]|uniref:Uncharacterized protein n=1 Tax=Leptospira congkakensis TaxID=2484932 RepID=A0A4Z0ZZ49_9LEPT|nr:hypothetical protein [Leptospira congkakensis]TGL86053.1 hypothetical protein EHQ69_18430 [Leptospira congkakensis]TGL88927.1 hypothetical protein EHQ68_09835 [Leptospira congkakensis]TGL93429.1 hypothetical protein EHQ70_18000 [Leptospira congkakensis]
MNLFETEFLFCILSGFFLFHTLTRISEEWKRKDLLFQWTMLTVLGFIIVESLKKWGIRSELWNTDSIFVYITKSNLLLFLSYSSLEERIFVLKPVRRILVSSFLYLFWVSLLFGIHFFQTTIQVQDNTFILPFAIALGAFVWTREMFWNEDLGDKRGLGDDSSRFIYLSFLPAAFLILSPWKTDVNFYNQVSAILFYGVSSFLGFLFVSKFKKETVSSESEIGIWIGGLAFSSCLGTEIVVVLPLAILSGIFGRLLYSYLSSLSWSESGIRGVVSFLYPSALGIFLPFLLTEPNEWVHAPYVLLGVQVLYFLSFYLVSSLCFGIILLNKQK